MSKPCMHIDINDNSFIIDELTAGNENVFDFVYRYYFKRLCAFCAQYIKEQDEIEEIVQNTMLQLWESRSNLVRGYSLKSLLFTIVRNNAINRISHYEIKNRVHQEIYEKYRQQFENPDFYFNDELFRLYDDAVKKIPEKYREVYEMSRNQNLTHSQIAKILNVSVQTVNYRIGQSLNILRIALKDYLVFISLALSIYL